MVFIKFVSIFALVMAKSKTSARHKAYTKKKNIQKQQKREMENKLKNTPQPINFAFHKDRKTVEIPIQLWQTLNETASRLQDIAMFVSTMQQVNQIHMSDGTLIPIFESDLVPTADKNPDGSPRMKLREDFYSDVQSKVPKVEEPKIEAPAPTI